MSGESKRPRILISLVLRSFCLSRMSGQKEDSQDLFIMSLDEPLWGHKSQQIQVEGEKFALD